jgi:opacity protein-like surface antigen
VLAPGGPGPRAADMPDDTYLRGSYSDDGPPSHVRWDGLHFGAHVGYTNLNADFSDATTASLAESSTSSTTFGGFLGYNIQWDNLVLGVDGAYNRASSLETSAASGTSSASIKLVDYATFRARAGYAFGQFLPYGFVGGAVGRVNYTTISAGVTTNSRDNAYAAGFTAGLGLDVSLLPNVFLRGEYEYVAYSPVGVIRSSTNTGRVGLGVRF